VTITVETHPHHAAYLAAMSNAPTAVTIIAVGGRHGPVAQAISAISSVSFGRAPQ
jgi:flavin reductase (DIM6/NTAB) family NADH-FMN oxidoreductase RutF